MSDRRLRLVHVSKRSVTRSERIFPRERGGNESFTKQGPTVNHG